MEVLGYCEEPLALVSEFMAGGDLKAVLSSDAKLSELPLIDRLQILQQAASGLGYLHSKDILHKDVKPGNILMESLR